MSAQIPETMLLSDLLKPTGYDCPEELIGRTFAEATAGGDVQTTKSITITENGTVNITPDTGYESMKKVAATVNVPIPVTKLYAWKLDTAVVYTKTAEPTTSAKALVGASTGLSESAIAAVADEFASITISTDVYLRYSDGDITIS